MGVREEEHACTDAAVRDGIGIYDVVLYRRADGSWSLHAKVSVHLVLGDGREVWGYKPLRLGKLNQEGRQRAQEGGG